MSIYKITNNSIGNKVEIQNIKSKEKRTLPRKLLVRKYELGLLTLENAEKLSSRI